MNTCSGHVLVIINEQINFACTDINISRGGWRASDLLPPSIPPTSAPWQPYHKLFVIIYSAAIQIIMYIHTYRITSMKHVYTLPHGHAPPQSVKHYRLLLVVLTDVTIIVNCNEFWFAKHFSSWLLSSSVVAVACCMHEIFGYLILEPT